MIVNCCICIHSLLKLHISPTSLVSLFSPPRSDGVHSACLLIRARPGYPFTPPRVTLAPPRVAPALPRTSPVAGDVTALLRPLYPRFLPLPAPPLALHTAHGAASSRASSNAGADADAAARWSDPALAAPRWPAAAAAAWARELLRRRGALASLAALAALADLGPLLRCYGRHQRRAGDGSGADAGGGCDADAPLLGLLRSVDRLNAGCAASGACDCVNACECGRELPGDVAPELPWWWRRLRWWHPSTLTSASAAASASALDTVTATAAAAPVAAPPLPHPLRRFLLFAPPSAGGALLLAAVTLTVPDMETGDNPGDAASAGVRAAAAAAAGGLALELAVAALPPPPGWGAGAGAAVLSCGGAERLCRRLGRRWVSLQAQARSQLRPQARPQLQSRARSFVALAQELTLAQVQVRAARSTAHTLTTAQASTAAATGAEAEAEAEAEARPPGALLLARWLERALGVAVVSAVGSLGDDDVAGSRGVDRRRELDADADAVGSDGDSNGEDDGDGACEWDWDWDSGPEGARLYPPPQSQPTAHTGSSSSAPLAFASVNAMADDATAETCDICFQPTDVGTPGALPAVRCAAPRCRKAFHASCVGAGDACAGPAASALAGARAGAADDGQEDGYDVMMLLGSSGAGAGWGQGRGGSGLNLGFGLGLGLGLGGGVAGASGVGAGAGTSWAQCPACAHELVPDEPQWPATR